MKAEIQLANGQSVFKPAEPVQGIVQWHSEKTIDKIDVRLIYYTSGKGTQDVHTVAVQTFSRPGASETRPFQLSPATDAHPWTFSGKLVSVLWKLELVVDDDTLAAESALTVSPTGKEIDLYAHDDGSADNDKKNRIRIGG